MNELNQMVDVNQIMNNIKEEIMRPQPSKDRIITYLYDLRIKEEYQSLSDSDYYDIVGKTFKLNPEFFMASIYGARELYKHVDRKEMAKHIIKKFCLYDAEKILYECHGSIKQSIGESEVAVSVSKGFFFVTTHRIIAQGNLKGSGGAAPVNLLDLVITTFSEISKKARGKTELIESSLDQELPCYGYQFQIKNHVNLKKSGNRWIRYIFIAWNIEDISSLSRMELIKARRFVRITLPMNTSKDKLNELFQVLCKDANQTVDSFRELHEMGINHKLKRKQFLYRLRQLWKSEEYEQLSDSEKIEIIVGVYELDPEFFMTSIYPKMISWKFPSFLNVRDEVITHIDKLSKESVPSRLGQDDDSIKFVKD